MSRFEVGSVVRLNSGGPLLTVMSTKTYYGIEGPQVEVSWITVDGKKSALFPEVCLTKNLLSVTIISFGPNKS